MENLTKNREASESRSQEIKNLYQEAKRIDYGMKMRKNRETIDLEEVWKDASEKLKDFIMVNGSVCTTWDELIEDLKKRMEAVVLEEIVEERVRNEIERLREEEDRKKREIEEMRNILMKEMKRERVRWAERNRMSRLRIVECYMCGERGHVARYCSSRFRRDDLPCLPRPE